MSFSGKPSSSEGQRKNTVFTFKKRTSKVDWRKLAAVDVSKIARELDFQCLQENIMNITFCDIEAEMDSQFVDSNFVKLFQLAQLIIEYLMHSQQFLQSKIGENERVLTECTQDLQKKEKELEDKENVVNHLKKENRKARKMLADYQLMMRTGASGIHKCPFCPKVFVSHEYLVSHQQRRHSRLLNTDAELPAKNSQVNNEVVQELQHIKERLASTERQLQEEKDAKQIEKEDKEMNKIKELEQRYAQWKEDEKQRQMNEMRDFKNSVMIELNEEKSALEQKIFELEKKSERVSLVRGIQDEDENHDASSRQQQQQQNDIQNIRKELHEEVTSIHTHAEENIKKLMDKYKKQELKMKKDNEAEKTNTNPF
ncbi:zinc finger protein DZIP1L-like [Xenia sp. Carnegie-2017]|uniref:zinc finger protein DZIP1L-like n=1 Tax=Xenia sp. Carnegie-2017 TaxID=2897299 RepID=UPI001F038154|nr:zinc finger protein DZIP1L-like [Xenia sp. Carnegie-2017]